jgi:hypothetical protein
MSETNRTQLHEALARLPQYEPPAATWQRLSEALDEEHWLDAQVTRLPSYAPPEEVWAAIEPELPVKRPASHRRWVGIGLLLLGLVGWVLWCWRTPTSADVSPSLPPAPSATWVPAAPIAQAQPAAPATRPTGRMATRKRVVASDVHVRTEVLNEGIRAVAGGLIDDAAEWLDVWCAEQVAVCKQPEFKALKIELDDLSLAKTELQTALGQYSDDPDLVARLVAIERERSQIIQKIRQLI